MKPYFFLCLLMFSTSLLSQSVTEEKESELDETTEIIDAIPFPEADTPPLMPGCEKEKKYDKQKRCTVVEVQKFFQKKFNIELASDLDLSGMVKLNVSFVIDNTGKVTQIGANGPHEKLIESLKDVAAQLPEFTPGIKDGKAVSVAYKMPIIFQVVD